MMPSSGRCWRGKGIVKGEATGPALLSATPISFLGDVEIVTGKVVGRSSDLYGAHIPGCVLLLPATRGSAGAWRFIYQLRMHETHPAAMVMRDMPDPSVVQGAILSGIPVIAGLPDRLWAEVRPGDPLIVDGNNGSVRLSDAPGLPVV